MSYNFGRQTRKSALVRSLLVAAIVLAYTFGTASSAAGQKVTSPTTSAKITAGWCGLVRLFLRWRGRISPKTGFPAVGWICEHPHCWIPARFDWMRRCQHHYGESYLAIAYIREKQPESARRLLAQLQRDFPQNPLFAKLDQKER